MDSLAVLIDLAFGLQPVFKFVAGFSASCLIKFIGAQRELILIGMIFAQSRLVFFSFLSFCCCYFLWVSRCYGGPAEAEIRRRAESITQSSSSLSSKNRFWKFSGRMGRGCRRPTL